MYTASKLFIHATALGVVLQSALALPTNDSKHAPRAAQVITSCTVPNTAAITFDDGPYKWNRKIVDTLNAAGAKGTFFVNGNNYDCIYNENNPENIKYAYDNGHQIASHTWAHLHLPTLSMDKIQSEFSKTNDAIQAITGAVPAFVRPPYGEYDENVLSIAGGLEQTVVTWDFDSGDSAGKSVEQSTSAYRTLVDSSPSSVLTLNHETYSSTPNGLLQNILPIFQQGGYRLVTVAECLGMDPYVSTGPPSGSGGSC